MHKFQAAAKGKSYLYHSQYLHQSVCEERIPAFGQNVTLWHAVELVKAVHILC